MLYGTYKFIMAIDSVPRAGFQECSSLVSTVDPIDYRDGDEPFAARKLPRENVSNIVLRRGVIDAAATYEWLLGALEGKSERKDILIILLDETGEEMCRWNVRNAWPIKWTGPSFAPKGDAAIETLEIAHEGVEHS